MRLVLGCGESEGARLDTVRVDLRPTGDVVADVRALPFEAGRFGEVVAHDVLEHVWVDDVPAMVSEWRRVSMPGGCLSVKVPDLVGLAERIVADPDGSAMFVRTLFGGHRWGPGGSWDAHHWGWAEGPLRRVLEAARWRVRSVWADGVSLGAEAVAS